MATRMALRSTGGSPFRHLARKPPNTNGAAKRPFSSSSAHHDDAYETAKWEKITYLGIATCTALAIYNLSKGHPHHEEALSYSYLRIRTKEFPWGPDGLFEKKHSDH